MVGRHAAHHARPRRAVATRSLAAESVHHRPCWQRRIHGTARYPDAIEGM